MILVYELVKYFDKYILDELDVVNVVNDESGMQIEYEQLKSQFINMYCEAFFMLSDNEKHDFDVLAFDKYCKQLERIGL